MKKLLFTSLAIGITILSQAQFKKGDITLAGSLSFSQQTPKNENGTTTINYSKNTNIQFSPSIGWALDDNTIYGFNLSYSHAKNTYSGTDMLKMNGYGAGVFLRKYAHLGSKFYFFTQGGLNGNFNKQDQYNNGTGIATTTQRSTQITLNIYPGIAYSLNRHWQLETGFPQLLSLYYGHSSETDKYTNGAPDAHSSLNTFGLSSVLSSNYQLSVGLRYFITKS